MKLHRHLLAALLSVLLASASAEEGLSHESEVWNAGVDACLAGDLTNAVEILRPLEGSKSHGARVAAVIAKAEYEAARAETNLVPRIEHLEAAAAAAQTALRANPSDTRLKDNLALATAELPALREERHLKDLLSSSAKKDPVSLLKKSLTDVRAVLADAESMMMLPPEDRIARGEALERRTKGLSDVCLVMKELAKGREGGAEQAVALLDKLREETLDAARRLGDLDAEAETSVTKVEAQATEFYRALLDAWSALSEDLNSQSNACKGVADIGRRSWQVDALAYTQGFRAKFPQWAEQYEQSRQADTNAPPLTAEVRQQIESLAEQLAQEQEACCQAPDSARQEKAADLIRQIMALKPQSPNKPQQQPQNQRQDQQQDPQQQQDQQQQKKEESDSQEQKDGQQNEQDQGSQDKQDDQKGEKDDEAESQKGEEDQKDEDRQAGEQGEEEKEDARKQQEQEGAEEQKAAAAEAEESEQEKSDKDLLMRVLERSAENKGKASKGRQKRPPTGSNRDW